MVETGRIKQLMYNKWRSYRFRMGIKNLFFLDNNDSGINNF
jgi:hypothetical protein